MFRPVLARYLYAPTGVLRSRSHEVPIRTACGFLLSRSLAIRMSCGELTAAQAGAESHEWPERTSRGFYCLVTRA